MILKDIEHAAGVDDNKRNGKNHGEEHDAESRTLFDKLPDAKVIVTLDGIKERAGGEHPPWVTRVGCGCQPSGSHSTR